MLEEAYDRQMADLADTRKRLQFGGGEQKSTNKALATLNDKERELTDQHYGKR